MPSPDVVSNPAGPATSDERWRNPNVPSSHFRESARRTIPDAGNGVAAFLEGSRPPEFQSRHNVPNPLAAPQRARGDSEGIGEFQVDPAGETLKEPEREGPPNLGDRIDAIIAHEWEEDQLGSHEAAMKHAPKTQLPISDGARRILRAMGR